MPSNEAKVTELEFQKNQIQDRISDLKKDISQAEADIAQAEKAKDEVSGRLSQKQAELKSLRDKANELYVQDNDIDEEIRKKTEEIKRLENSLAGKSTAGSKSNLDNEIKRLQEQVDLCTQYEAQIKQKQEAMKRKREEADSKKDLINELDSRLRKVETELAGYLAGWAGYESQNQKLKEKEQQCDALKKLHDSLLNSTKLSELKNIEKFTDGDLDNELLKNAESNINSAFAAIKEYTKTANEALEETL